MVKTSGIVKVSYQKKKKYLISITLISLFIVLLLLSSIILTFVKADKIMREPKKPLTEFASNILPPYELATFESLDGHTRLNGWLLKTKNPISTIIMVHDNGANRLQFDLETAELYHFLLEQGYNILTFDLRHSGQSDGDLSTYGYSEYIDVLSAILYVKKMTTTNNVILYGMGSGVTASLLAYEHMADATQVNNTADSKQPTNSISERLTFDKSYVKGFIFDSLAFDSDMYVKADLKTTGVLGNFFFPKFVPAAIRLSTESSENINIATTLSKIQIPILIIENQKAYKWYKKNRISDVIAERQRIYDDYTVVFSSNVSHYVDAWELDQDNYKESLKYYLQRFFKANP